MLSNGRNSRRRLWLWPLGCAIAFFLAFPFCTPEVPCQAHDECPSGLCQGGFCNPPKPCRASSECDALQSCRSGSCKSATSCFPSCPASERCQVENATPRCVPQASHACQPECPPSDVCQVSGSSARCLPKAASEPPPDGSSEPLAEPLPEPPSEPLPCSDGRTRCSGRCADLRTDLEHCGACGGACPSGQACLEGSCQIPSAGTRQTFTASGTTFALRYIPSGSFLMGSPDTDTEAGTNEKPQRTVTITRGFWMLETEVTQGQYKAILGSNPSKFPACGDSCPVESVSWDEARAFADKLSAVQGLPSCTATDTRVFQCQGWRLPTEAEWEYAARAGTTSERYGALHDIARYNSTSRAMPWPVGGKQANSWGFYDLLGNVWEWTLDIYTDTYTGLPTSDPLRTSGGEVRAIRGGSLDSPAERVRAAMRLHYAPSLRLFNLGFRIVRY